MSKKKTYTIKLSDKPAPRLEIGIDVDEVLRSTLPEMVRLYNENFGQNLTVDDVKDFDVSISFPEIEKQTGINAAEWFFDIHGTDLFYNSKPIGDVADITRRLSYFGRITIVTWQKSLQNKIDTLNWLKRYNVYYDDICFIKHKHLLKLDYMIDDNHKNFFGSHSNVGVLIDAPYNSGVDTHILKTQSHCDYICRFRSLDDFVKDWEDERWTK